MLALQQTLSPGTAPKRPHESSHQPLQMSSLRHDLSNSFRSEQSYCKQVGNSVSCLKDLELFKMLFSFQAF